MADVRITGLTPAAAPPSTDGSRSAAARAAQAAFFQAALGQATSGPAAAVAPLRPVTAVTPLATSVAPRAAERVRFDADTPTPTRPLRPGSLIDIKV